MTTRTRAWALLVGSCLWLLVATAPAAGIAVQDAGTSPAVAAAQTTTGDEDLLNESGEAVENVTDGNATSNLTDDALSTDGNLTDAVDGDANGTVDGSVDGLDGGTNATGGTSAVDDTLTTVSSPAGPVVVDGSADAVANLSTSLGSGSLASLEVSASASTGTDGDGQAADSGDGSADGGAGDDVAIWPGLAPGWFQPPALPLQGPGSLALGSLIAGLAAAGAARRSASVGLGALAERLPRIFPFGYSRYDDSDPLEHEVRATLHEAVEAEPGVNLSALADRVDVSMSTVRHHLDVLVDEGLVTTEQCFGKRCYFPLSRDSDALAAALGTPATAAILEALAERGPSTVSQLAEAVDRDASTVSHHLSRLEEVDLLERERDGRAVRASLSPVARRALGGDDPPAAAARSDD